MPTPVPYTTPALVRALVARTTESRPGTGASIEDSQILEAISAAAQKIDSVLGVVFPVPFNPVPQLITDAATAIGALELDMTFREVRDYQSELNPVMLRAKRYEDQLIAIRKGEAVIPGYVPPDEEVPDNPGDGGSIVDVINSENDVLDCQPDYWDRYYGRTL